MGKDNRHSEKRILEKTLDELYIKSRAPMKGFFVLVFFFDFSAIIVPVIPISAAANAIHQPFGMVSPVFTAAGKAPVTGSACAKIRVP